MNIGMIGLGKMGSNMVRRLMKGGHRCFVYDVDPGKARGLAQEGATAAFSLDELLEALRAASTSQPQSRPEPQPKIVWLMLPSGQVTESAVTELKEKLSAQDIVIDGGNSHFKDAIRRAQALAEKKIRFLDVGTSGGVWGMQRGYCLMIGGEEGAFRELEPIFSTLAPGPKLVPGTPGRKSPTTAESGYLHCGPVGSGHFVKMIHNGIEYGLMQSFAEGYDILKGSQYELNLAEITELWRRGSVISSWLLDLLAISMNGDPLLSKYVGDVQDSGEGRWTVQAAIEEAVSADVISAALFARFRSRRAHTFGEKVLSAMRHAFGGHVEAQEAGDAGEPGEPGRKKAG